MKFILVALAAALVGVDAADSSFNAHEFCPPVTVGIRYSSKIMSFMPSLAMRKTAFHGTIDFSDESFVAKEETTDVSVIAQRQKMAKIVSNRMKGKHCAASSHDPRVVYVGKRGGSRKFFLACCAGKTRLYQVVSTNDDHPRSQKVSKFFPVTLREKSEAKLMKLEAQFLYGVQQHMVPSSRHGMSKSTWDGRKKGQRMVLSFYQEPDVAGAYGLHEKQDRSPIDNLKDEDIDIDGGDGPDMGLAEKPEKSIDGGDGPDMELAEKPEKSNSAAGAAVLAGDVA